MVIHRYNDEEKSFLREFVPGHSYKEITVEFNRRFLTNLTIGQIKSSIGRYGLNTGRTGRFEKGHIPANKGTHPKTTGRMGETQFKEGHLPHNTKPLGYERISKDGYIEVKIAMRRSDTEKNNFVAKHRLLWEKLHGPIPKGCNVIFLDGNKRNFSPENLALVTKAENLEMTRSGLRNDDLRLAETGLLVAKSIIKTREAKKRKKENKNAIEK